MHSTQRFCGFSSARSSSGAVASLVLRGFATAAKAEWPVLSPQLPASFFAYRKQQHRWTCGPVQLWCRCAADIWRSALPLTTKLELLVLYFGLRKFATHWVSLGFFCTLVPLTVFTPEVRCPAGLRRKPLRSLRADACGRGVCCL